MRHFEKTSARRMFRTVEVEGANLFLTFGYAGAHCYSQKTKFKNATQAKAAGEKWVSYALRSGFKEFPVDSKVSAVITSVEGTKGARAASDDRRNIFVSYKDVKKLKLMQGSRVLLDQIHKSKKSVPSFMFKSPWVAEEVELFPRPLKHNIEKYEKFSGKEISQFKKQAGSKISSYKERKPGKYKCGDLIFGYYPGIFRFIGYTKMYGEDFPVMEQVFGENFNRLLYLPFDCHPNFCEKIPSSLEAILESQ